MPKVMMHLFRDFLSHQDTFDAIETIFNESATTGLRLKDLVQRLFYMNPHWTASRFVTIIDTWRHDLVQLDKLVPVSALLPACTHELCRHRHLFAYHPICYAYMLREKSFVFWLAQDHENDNEPSDASSSSLKLY